MFSLVTAVVWPVCFWYSYTIGRVIQSNLKDGKQALELNPAVVTMLLGALLSLFLIAIATRLRSPRPQTSDTATFAQELRHMD